MKSVLSTPDAGKPQPVQESFALSPAEFDNVDRIEFTSVLTTAGFGCFWAWMLAMLVLSPVTLDNGLSAGLMGLAARLAVVAVMALVAVTVYVGGRLRPEFNSQITLVKVLIALTPLPFFAALLLNRYLLAVPDFVIVATAAVAGVSCGLLLLSWGVTWATVDRSKPFNRSTAKSIAASFLLAGLLLVFIWMAPANLSVIVAIALYAASAITQHICSIRMPHTRSSNPGADEDADKGSEAGAPAPAGASHPATDAPVKLYHLSRYMPLFISAVAGGQLSWLSLTQPEELLVPMMAGGFAVGSLVVLGYIAIRGHIPLLNTLERLLVP
ncbi:MAG: hypothetical protein LBR39_06780, partial [Coriobacteriales bacterium]|nr:hypothetical protein [Coriobacteriales bacterium]